MSDKSPNPVPKFTPKTSPNNPQKPGLTALPAISEPTSETVPKISEPGPEVISEPSAEPIRSTTSPPGHDGSHLDAIEIGDDPGAPPPPKPGPATAEATAGDGFVTRDIFAQNFAGAFAFAGGMTGLQSLTAAPEAQTCRPAADALYDTCRDTPWLHFLVRPGSVWLQRTLAIMAFAAPLVRETAAEVKARRYQPPATGNADAPDDVAAPPSAGDDPAHAWGIAA